MDLLGFKLDWHHGRELGAGRLLACLEVPWGLLWFYRVSACYGRSLVFESVFEASAIGLVYTAIITKHEHDCTNGSIGVLAH